MAISYLTASLAGGTNTATTGAINTTGANLIVISLGSQQTSGTPSFSDSAGNTWTFGLKYNVAAWQGAWMYYCSNPNVSTGHTFSFSFTGGNSSNMIVSAFSGAATSSVLESFNGFSNTSFVSNVQPGAITTTQGNEMLLTFIYWNNTPAPTISTDFTVIRSTNTPQAAGAAYKITTSTGSFNPTWSNGTNNSLATFIASFKYNPSSTPVVNTSSSWFTIL
jgi:hypothetical protein